MIKDRLIPKSVLRTVGEISESFQLFPSKPNESDLVAHTKQPGKSSSTRLHTLFFTTQNKNNSQVQDKVIKVIAYISWEFSNNSNKIKMEDNVDQFLYTLLAAYCTVQISTAVFRIFWQGENCAPATLEPTPPKGEKGESHFPIKSFCLTQLSSSIALCYAESNPRSRLP